MERERTILLPVKYYYLVLGTEKHQIRSSTPGILCCVAMSNQQSTTQQLRPFEFSAKAKPMWQDYTELYYFAAQCKRTTSRVTYIYTHNLYVYSILQLHLKLQLQFAVLWMRLKWMPLKQLYNTIRTIWGIL